MSNRDVVIVGLGPAGAAAATYFAEAGWNVRGYDKRASPESTDATDLRGYAFTLSPRGLELLPESTRRAIDSHCHPLERRVFVYPDGTQRSYRYGDRSQDRLYAVARSVFQKKAIAAARVAGAHLHFSTPVIDLNPVSGQIVICCGDENASDVADLVVAADGAFSVSRSRISAISGSSYSVRFDGVRFVSVAVSADEGLRLTGGTAGLHFFMSKHGTDVFIPTPPTSTLLVMSRLIPRDGVLTSDLAKTLSLSRNPVIGRSIPALDSRLAGAPVGHFVNTEMNVPFAGRCVIVGDAWNAIPAYSGQGVNAALQDVKALVDSVSRENAIAPALERYSKTRRISREAIGDLNVSIGRDLMNGRYGGALWRAKESLRSRFGMRSTYQKLVLDGGDRPNEYN